MIKKILNELFIIISAIILYLAPITFVVFTILKLADIIPWSWVIVCSPIITFILMVFSWCVAIVFGLDN